MDILEIKEDQAYRLAFNEESFIDIALPYPEANLTTFRNKLNKLRQALSSKLHCSAEFFASSISGPAEHVVMIMNNSLYVDCILTGMSAEEFFDRFDDYYRQIEARDEQARETRASTSEHGVIVLEDMSSANNGDDPREKF